MVEHLSLIAGCLISPSVPHHHLSSDLSLSDSVWDPSVLPVITWHCLDVRVKFISYISHLSSASLSGSSEVNSHMHKEKNTYEDFSYRNYLKVT